MQLQGLRPVAFFLVHELKLLPADTPLLGIFPAEEPAVQLPLKRKTEDDEPLLRQLATAQLPRDIPVFVDVLRLERECLDEYRFRQPGFAQVALSHCSAPVPVSNQALEFLGDAVLDLVVARHYDRLLREAEAADPGYFRLAPRLITGAKHSLLNNGLLATSAVKLGLHRYLVATSHPLQMEIDKFAASVADLLEGAMPDGYSFALRASAPKPLGDLMEALVGALYLDIGGDIDQTWAKVRPLLTCMLPGRELPTTESLLVSGKHPKSRLLEIAAGAGLEIKIDTSNAQDPAPAGLRSSTSLLRTRAIADLRGSTFRCTVTASGPGDEPARELACCRGSTKATAEVRACMVAIQGLELLDVDPEEKVIDQHAAQDIDTDMLD